MRNFVRIGPVRVRVGSRDLASWGWSRVVIGALDLWSWTNTGELMLAGYHPKSSHTWIWAIYIGKRDRQRKLLDFAPVRRGQWFDYIALPFGCQIRIGHQSRMNKTPRGAIRKAEVS